MTQARFVHIVDDVPELDEQDEGPVMLVALDGFLDAGNASALAVEHLVGSVRPARPPVVAESWRASRWTSSTTTARAGLR